MKPGALPSPCPRFATHNEWEAWHQSLTWEEQLRRNDLDPPEHVYGDEEVAKAEKRAAGRSARRLRPDPFSYSGERGTGPWPRIDQFGAPTLSNQWRMDPNAGYSPGGFALRMRRVAHRDLVEERMPARQNADPEARLTWLHESIERAEARQRDSLLLVLRERHGKLEGALPSPTAQAMAWNHLLALRAELRALRELAREAEPKARAVRRQLDLF